MIESDPICSVDYKKRYDRWGTSLSNYHNLKPPSITTFAFPASFLTRLNPPQISTLANPGHINRVISIAAQNGWIVQFEDSQGQDRRGVFIHLTKLILSGVRVSAGRGPNRMAARDAACWRWLIDNGFLMEDDY
ncbi:hypothetical protein DL93DRAFT_2101428 [Clavulina sp. PMI_390]|nr:hypothetical protein DL93DRAFT_2101428 [Clavulina sp. PMI_390]